MKHKCILQYTKKKQTKYLCVMSINVKLHYNFLNDLPVIQLIKNYRKIRTIEEQTFGL